MTGYKSKRDAALDEEGMYLVHHTKRKADDDDDIQVYKRPWVGLTDDEIKEIVGPWGDTPIKGYTRELIDKIEAKLRSKN